VRAGEVEIPRVAAPGRPLLDAASQAHGAALKRTHTGGQQAADEVADRFVFIAPIRDATRNRLAEEALQANEAELRRANSYLTIAQRLSKTGSFTWDLTTNESRWSDEMYRIFEIGRGHLVPSALAREVVHPDDRPVIDALLPRAREGEDFDVEFRLITPRGDVKHVHVVGNLLEGGRENPVFVGAVQDVTDRRVAEEALDRARRELAHVSWAATLSALTASIAHEVNQPLAGILTNSSTCLRMLAVDPPNIEVAQAAVQRTIRDGNRASEVIKRLRALFAGKPPGNEPVDLNEAAREILMLSSSELQSGRVVLQTDLTADLPAVVGDRVQLQQVILNLVLNAAQSMQGIVERPHDLTVSTMRYGADQVALSVRDAGVGAVAEDLEELFNAFYTTKPDGMGVGLPISRSIIQAHGGRLWASANDGPGLTLSFCVPVMTSLPTSVSN
jgi:PAS domain S-box-containing protein